jgi:hypothetical protein
MPTLTYRGLPVFTERPEETKTLTRGQERMLLTLDFDTGKTQVIDTANRAFQTLEHRFLLASRARMNAFLDFLYALNGQQKALWLPTHAADLVLEDIAVGPSLPVKRAGYARFGLDTAGRMDILITLADGALLARRIVAAMEDGNIDRLAVSPELPRPIYPEEVERISFLTCMRLAHDDVEIEHVTDGNGVARAALNFRGCGES